jgi:hypothetical protein
MTLRLILRDRALRRLPGWLVLGVLIGLMLSAYQQDAVRHGLTLGQHGYQGFRYVAYLPWGLLALYLLVGGVTLRCERFELALPCAYGTLWLARVLALALASFMLVGTAAATLLLRNWLEGFQVVGRTQVESLLAQLLAGAFLSVVLARLPSPSLHELPTTPGNGLYLALVWGGVLAVIFLLAGSAPGCALLPGGVAFYSALASTAPCRPRPPSCLTNRSRHATDRAGRCSH